MFKATVKYADVYTAVFIFLTRVTVVQAVHLLCLLAALISRADLAEPFLTVTLLRVYCLTARGIGVESELYCWCLSPLLVPSSPI